MKRIKFQAFSYCLLFLILGSIVTIAQLLHAPSELSSQLFMGYSLKRWLLVIIAVTILSAEIYLFFLSLRKINQPPRWFQFLQKPPKQITLMVFLLCILFCITMLISSNPVWFNQSIINRLRPLLFSANWISWIYLCYLILICKQLPWKIALEEKLLLESSIQKKLPAFDSLLRETTKEKRFIGLVILFTFPLLFSNAFRYELPNGFAGLYALMAELLAQNNYILPVSVPYYGPGGMPFAYPPAGFYLMAFFTATLKMPVWVYLRFAPPLFMGLAMIPISLLTFKWLKSRGAAILVPVLIASSQAIYSAQATSGGIVRGLAYLFAVSGIYFFVQSTTSSKWLYYSIVSGLCFGLTGLTHLGYLEFGALFILAWILTHPFQFQTWRSISISGGIGLLLVFPWVITMIQRYSWTVFKGAFQSHGNDHFLLAVSSLQKLEQWFNVNLAEIFKFTFLWGIILSGILLAVLNGKWLLPLWFGLILLIMSESARYSITCGAFLMGVTAKYLAKSLSCSYEKQALSLKPKFFFFLMLCLFLFQGWQIIPKSNHPLIQSDSLTLAEFIQTQTPPETKYLVVADTTEAEWYPYLFRREPVAASWGGEWQGTYPEHLGYLLQIIECQENGSANCLQNVMSVLPKKADLVITHTGNTLLNENISSFLLWETLYQNQEYIVWKTSAD